MKFSSFAPALASFPGAAEQEVYTQQVATIPPGSIAHSQDATDLVLHAPGRIIYLEVHSAADGRVLGYIITSDAVGTPHIAVYDRTALPDFSPSQRLQLIARASALLFSLDEYETLFKSLCPVDRNQALIDLQKAIVNRLLEA